MIVNSWKCWAEVNVFWILSLRTLNKESFLWGFFWCLFFFFQSLSHPLLYNTCLPQGVKGAHGHAWKVLYVYKIHTAVVLLLNICLSKAWQKEVTSGINIGYHVKKYWEGSVFPFFCLWEDRNS